MATGDGRRPPRRSPRGASPQGVGKDRGWVRSHEVGDEARNPRRAGDSLSRRATVGVVTRRFRRIARLRRPARGARSREHALSFKVMGVGFAAERRRGPAWKQAGSCRRDRAGSSCSGSGLTRRGGSPIIGAVLCVVHFTPPLAARGPPGLRFRGCAWWRGCPGLGSSRSRVVAGWVNKDPERSKVKALEGLKPRRAAAVRRGATHVGRERIRRRNERLRSR